MTLCQRLHLDTAMTVAAPATRVVKSLGLPGGYTRAVAHWPAGPIGRPGGGKAVCGRGDPCETPSRLMSQTAGSPRAARGGSTAPGHWQGRLRRAASLTRIGQCTARVAPHKRNRSQRFVAVSAALCLARGSRIRTHTHTRLVCPNSNKLVQGQYSVFWRLCKAIIERDDKSTALLV